MSVRDPTISGTQVAKMSHASIPGLLSSRSTCLTACLVRRAWAKDLPIIATASDAPVITPSVAFARESTRFAWISSERILSRKLLTSLNCMHVRFVPSIILLNKAASVEQYYRFTHADASAGNEGILEMYQGSFVAIGQITQGEFPKTKGVRSLPVEHVSYIGFLSI